LEGAARPPPNYRMNGLYKGSYVVTIRNSIGGNIIYDIGYIVSGRGIMSEPWVVCSLQTWDKYQVTAIQISKESYYSNNTQLQAEQYISY